MIIAQSAEADQRRTIEILRAHADVGLSYVDALVLAVADRLSAEELLTVDSHLGAVRLDRALIVTVLWPAMPERTDEVRGLVTI